MADDTAPPKADPPTQPDAVPHVPVDPRLLDVLVCPLTKGVLVYDRVANELISRSAGLAYPIRDGIPIMLPEEARRLDEP
jgi:uncharacterized protein YbaR (Trm112 family)